MRHPVLTLILVLFFALPAFSFLPNYPTEFAKASSLVAHECEGNACSVVTFSWDEERQQFRIQNDSNQPVKIEVSTFAGASSVSVPAHQVRYLEVKTFNGAYHANYE
jgi:hypothetical protein